MPGLVVSDTDPTQIFQVLAKLGEGSYGSVFKALDKRDGQTVAVKVLEVENDDTTDLQKEINILKECHSEYIVDYKGTYENHGNIWIVMEYCGAGSLCDLMAICDKTLTEEQIAVVMKMSLHGLAYLHSQKKIHRDIKSGNILLTHDGDCKLADFGVSAELTTTLAKRKTVIGTPYWMAPEVLQSTEYDGRADIWSLAITAIELALGEPPHSNIHPMRAIFMIPSADPPTLPPDAKWSKDFRDFLKVCLCKNPEERPQAATLLASHPFLKKAKSKAVIAALVDECMLEIDEFRQKEADELEDEGDEGDAVEANENTMKSEISTIDTKSLAGTMGTGTMVNFSAGTMVAKDFGLLVGGGGTMVAGTMVATADPSGTQPSYMKHLGQHKHAASGGTFKPGGVKNQTLGGGDFMQYYKNNKKVEVDNNSSLPDLRQTLVALNKAEEEEAANLKTFYAQKRKQVQDLIKIKEKK